MRTEPNHSRMKQTLQESIPYDHESNGAAERAIQTVRRHANVLLDELRERTQLSIPHEHPRSVGRSDVQAGYSTALQSAALQREHLKK